MKTTNKEQIIELAKSKDLEIKIDPMDFGCCQWEGIEFVINDTIYVIEFHRFGCVDGENSIIIEKIIKHKSTIQLETFIKNLEKYKSIDLEQIKKELVDSIYGDWKK